MGVRYEVMVNEGPGTEVAPLLSSHRQEEAVLSHDGASIGASTFNLANSIIGAGILSLPFAFHLTGFGLGAIILILTAVGADYTIRLLLKCGETARRKTYEGIMDASFGRPGVWIVSAAIILLNIGSLTAYYVILGDVLPPLWRRALGDKNFIAHEFYQRLFCTGVVTLVILIPLGLMRSVTNLAFTSMLSLFCVLSFTTLMVVVCSLNGLVDTPIDNTTITSTISSTTWAPTNATGHDDVGKPEAFRMHSDIFRAFSLFAFAFTCHSVVYPVFLELRNPSIARMMHVVHYSMGLCFFLYALVSFSGYWHYGDRVKGDVLLNVEEDESDAVSLAVQIAYAISIISTFPMGLAPLRQALSGLVYHNAHPTSWPLVRHVSLSLGVIGICFVFALYIPVLDFVFGLTGATAGVLIVYILPPAMTLKLNWPSLGLASKIGLSVLITLGIALGVCATLFTVLDYVQSSS